MSVSGKARSLKLLKEAGFLVPDFLVCESYIENSELLSLVETKLPQVNYFAVRSSAAVEDSANQSFAGHFYSAIGVPKSKLYEELNKVRGSYRGSPGVVIIQEFIPSDRAGVIFFDSSNDTQIINSTLGLCQPVVQGKECDEFICDKKGGVIRKAIGKGKISQRFRDGHIVVEKIDDQSLNNRQIKTVVEAASKIEAFFGSPQDIEWCFMGDELYILQSRPITRKLNFNPKEEEYFDSANIAESYSGVVLPLTCSFAKLVYEQVYRDLLRMSGVPKKQIEKNSDVFQNLLGFYYGRMFYNMNNWYKLAAFLPGYKRNKENFEIMITSNIKKNISTSIRPSSILKAAYPFIVLVKVCLYGITSRIFRHQVKKEIRNLREVDFFKLDYNESVDIFNYLKSKLLTKWYVTLENDFFVMTYLGILKKYFDDQTLQELIIFPSKATEQIICLSLLSKKAKNIKELWKTIESNDVAGFNLEIAKHEEFRFDLNNYLIQFGGRFANELKLESVDIEEDHGKLLAVLRTYGSFTPKATGRTKPEIKAPWLKKIWLNFILAKFKKYASRREEFRLLRSNMFAITRKLFRRMGDILVEQAIISNTEDVFYLSLEDLLSHSDTDKADLLKKIIEAKSLFKTYIDLEIPSHFTINGGRQPQLVNNETKPSVLVGRPASPGSVEGIVRIFKEFMIPEKIDFDLLVTKHTDPGWTPLIALSKGLIIEHGGVLSHASIIARELGIPAVIGAQNATELLKDSQIVEIDGSTGIITLK